MGLSFYAILFVIGCFIWAWGTFWNWLLFPAHPYLTLLCIFSPGLLLLIKATGNELVRSEQYAKACKEESKRWLNEKSLS